MVSIDLAVKNLTQSNNTGENICEALEEMIQTWKISKQNIVSILSDNGANTVSAVKQLLFM